MNWTPCCVCSVCVILCIYIYRTNHKFSLLFLLCLRTQRKQPRKNVRVACEAVLPVKKNKIKSKTS